MAGQPRRWNVLYASVNLAGGTTSITHIARAAGMDLPRHPLSNPGGFDVTWRRADAVFQLRLLQDFRDNLAIDIASACREDELYQGNARWNVVARGLQLVASFLPVVDGIVLVVDSQHQRLEGVEERVNTLAMELRAAGREPRTVPVAFQLNKRDLANAAPLADLLAATRWPGPSTHVESIAHRGVGVEDALDGLVALMAAIVDVP